MRCPKCGNEVDFKAMECARCGLATPKGQKPGTGSLKKPGNTGKLSTGRLKSNARKSFLPPFLANSPLARINVSPKLVVPIILLFPLTALAFYLLSSNQICLNCIQIGGKYSAELPLNDNKYQLEIRLYQYQSALSGQVLFIPNNPIPDMTNATVETPAATQPDRSTNNKLVEIIQGGSVSSNEVNFQTYPRQGDTPRVQFNGQFEGNLLKGNLKVTIPELNCPGKSFPIAVQRQLK